MIRIRLATRDGGHVTDVTIPPFHKLPEVLVLGFNRVFQFHADMRIDGEPCCAEYREVFCYMIPRLAEEE
jgi:hypothetical protein